MRIGFKEPLAVSCTSVTVGVCPLPCEPAVSHEKHARSVQILANQIAARLLPVRLSMKARRL